LIKSMRGMALAVMVTKASRMRESPSCLGGARSRRHHYATIINDAETGQSIDVLPDREAVNLQAWLRGTTGIEVVCRDGSPTSAEAIRRALPDAAQVSDRWRLWRNLCDKVLAEVRAHAACWAGVSPPRPGGVREQTTRERWHMIHQRLDQGVGLLDCSRRLGLALNTVKHKARIPEATAQRIAPQCRPTLVDLCRDHLRTRRAADPTIPCHPTAPGNQGAGLHRQRHLLVRYLNQGRAKGDHPVTTPRHAARAADLPHLPASPTASNSTGPL